MRSEAATVDEYVASLHSDRREAISAVRKAILKNLPKGYVEMMDFGMIAYVVPLSTLRDTYNGHPLSYAGLHSQKNHMSVYLMNVYGHAPTRRWFEAAYNATGKRLDMGKSCVRFRRLDDLPLDVIGKAIARTPMDEYVEAYLASRRPPTKPRK